MNDDLNAGECRLLDQLYDGSLPTGGLPGPILVGLISRGLVETTWAGRARLTSAGRELFQVTA